MREQGLEHRCRRRSEDAFSGGRSNESVDGASCTVVSARCLRSLKRASPLWPNGLAPTGQLTAVTHGSTSTPFMLKDGLHVQAQETSGASPSDAA